MADVIEFIKNELIAIEYFHYFAFLNWYYANFISSEKKDLNQVENEREMVKIAEQKISDFDIHDYYNDYGIFSRKLAIQYFHFYLNNLNRIENPEIYSSRRTITKEFEVGKMILGGSIYYRVLAERITSSLTKGLTYFLLPASYDLKNALNLIDQLIDQSNSNHFKSHLKSFRDKRLNWENENYIPETTFYNPDGNTIKLKEIVKNKPTILYITNNWGRYRYDFDNKATKNPNIRYVMIVEGENLAEWQDYIKSAEPVAGQLFLLNHKIHWTIFFSVPIYFTLFTIKMGNL
jgi:hypothetical protein